MCSVSIAATSFQVSSRSVSERSEGLVVLELEIEVVLVEGMDVDVDGEEVLCVPDSPLAVSLELNSGNDATRSPTSFDRR